MCLIWKYFWFRAENYTTLRVLFLTTLPSHYQYWLQIINQYKLRQFLVTGSHNIKKLTNDLFINSLSILKKLIRIDHDILTIFWPFIRLNLKSTKRKSDFYPLIIYLSLWIFYVNNQKTAKINSSECSTSRSSEFCYLKIC